MTLHARLLALALRRGVCGVWREALGAGLLTLVLWPIALSCYKDSRPPKVNFIFPDQSDTLAPGIYRVRARATDRSIILRTFFYVDDTCCAVDSQPRGDTFGFVWDANKKAYGRHKLRASCLDQYWNFGEAEVNVIIARDTGRRTVHGGLILKDEVWSASGNPHMVMSDVSVENSATLTIGPGCIVKLDSGVWFYCGYGSPGAIVACGTAESSIVFTSPERDPRPGDWAGLGAFSMSLPTTEFRHCQVEYAGGNSLGAVVIDGAEVRFDECRVEWSASNGLYCSGSGRFLSFAGNLVTSCSLYSLNLEPDAVQSIGLNNQLSGSLYGACAVRSGTLHRGAVWRDLGVPYDILGDVSIGDRDSLPVLSLEPGCQLRFAMDAGLYVGSKAPGGLWADGSASRIRFTGVRPRRGDWKSLFFGGAAMDGSCCLRYCTIAWGGLSDSGNIHIRDAAPDIRSDSIIGSLTYGIFLDGGSYPSAESLLANNYFSDDSLGAIRRP